MERINERIIKCPRCNKNIKETYYMESCLENAHHYSCAYCGYSEYEAYNSIQKSDNLETYDTFLLPCQPGTKIYCIHNNSIIEDIVKEWIINEEGIFFLNQNNNLMEINLFGTTVFVDKNLAKIKNEK